MMELALLDATTNCERDGATVRLTLGSGVVIEGRLSRGASVQREVHLKHANGGWSTVQTDAIVAVTTVPA